MEILKKSTATIAAFAISASAFAGPDLDTRVNELEKKVDMMSTTTVAGTYGPKTALARPEPEGQGWFLSFDVLYWQTKIDGTEYVLTDSALTNIPVQIVGKVNNVDFNYDFGLKAGIGYNFFHDGWDTELEFTYFNQSGSGKTGARTPSALIPLRSPLTVAAPSEAAIASGLKPLFATSATSNVSMNYDNLNWELGRNAFTSKNLAFRPHFGLKSAWIQLKQSTRYSGGGTATVLSVNGNSIPVTGLGVNTVYVKEKSDFWGIGPRTGINSKWFLANGFSIYGDIDGALLYGYYETASKQWWSLNDQNVIRLKQKYHMLTPTIHFGLGLAYDKYIYNDQQHLSLSLGYENEYYWDIYRTIQADFLGRGAVGFFGVTFKIRWDF